MGIGLATAGAIALAAGAALAQQHNADRPAVRAIEGKPLATRIGPVYGPDAGGGARTLIVDVVTDFVPPSREPTGHLDLDDVRRTATMVCSDCETGVAMSPTRARHFSDRDDGMTLIVVLENGSGMRGGRLDSAKDGLRRVLSGNYRQGRDRLTLATIGKDFRVVADFSASDSALLQAIDKVRTEEAAYPRMYWGMTKALEMFDQLDTTFPSRRRMLVISTGRDQAPESQAAGAIRDNDVIERAQKANVTIDAIGIPSPLPAQKISLVPPDVSGLPSQSILIPAAQSMDSYLDALEKIARGTGGLFLRHDPHGAPIAQRLAEGMQWLKDTPVLTFDLTPAIHRDGRKHRIALRIASQPDRDFEATIVMPAGVQFPYSSGLVVFVAALLGLSIVVLLRGRSRGKNALPVPAPATTGPREASLPEFERNGIARDDTMREPGVRSAGSRLRIPGQEVANGARSSEPMFVRQPAEPGRSSTRVLTSSFPMPGPNSPCCTVRVLSGPRSGVSFSMVWEEASIGREDERNTIAVLDPGISSRHATLRWNSGVLTITDDHSTNGTRVGNVQLSPLRPHPLQAGDRIQMGSTVMMIEAPFVAN